jgi:hypothetical protein
MPEPPSLLTSETAAWNAGKCNSTRMISTTLNRLLGMSLVKKVASGQPSASTFSKISMNFLVTRCTKNHEILGRVIAHSAPRLDVVNLKIFHSPAPLASPPVSLQHLTAKLSIGFGVQL